MKRRKTHTREWHEARLAEGPMGFIRSKGVTSWEQLQSTMQALMDRWEAMPDQLWKGYAFPNQEDRKAR
jgi:hypothetical protein